MKEIVIISGKGGVGKSAITAALGCILAEKHRVLLTDTDVDAPNLHLVLGARLRDSLEISASEKACIDYDRCSGCLTCFDICRFAAIIAADEPIIVPYACEGCGACVIGCPEGAIAIRPVVNGRLNIMAAGNLPVVAGELSIGASSSGRLVDLVKRRARQEAAAGRAEILLTDGPPGIGCPVIAALKGADYTLVITEPSNAALHDMQRVMEVAEHFRVPVGIVINKADIHEQSRAAIHAFAAKSDVPILAEIPYDNSVPIAIANAQPVVAAFPDAPASLQINKLAQSLMDAINNRPSTTTT
jgi:MinD superfamily P-loop ATPase